MPARLTVYYDGLCQLCSREIAFYRRRVSPTVAEFVDIADPIFEPAAFGFDRVALHRHLHAVLDGKLLIGVEAFRALWLVVPGFVWMARLLDVPGIGWLAERAYAVFVRVRPWLPKRKCAGGVCRV